MVFCGVGDARPFPATSFETIASSSDQKLGETKTIFFDDLSSELACWRRPLAETRRETKAVSDDFCVGVCWRRRPLNGFASARWRRPLNGRSSRGRRRNAASPRRPPSSDSHSQGRRFPDSVDAPSIVRACQPQTAVSAPSRVAGRNAVGGSSDTAAPAATAARSRFRTTAGAVRSSACASAPNSSIKSWPAASASRKRSKSVKFAPPNLRGRVSPKFRRGRSRTASCAKDAPS